MEKYDNEIKKIDKIKSGVIKKDIVNDKDDDFDLVSQKLQHLIYMSPIDKIKKSLIKMNFKGRIQTNKMLLNIQLGQQFNTIDQMKQLIKLLQE